MNQTNKECPICKSQASYIADYNNFLVFYMCPICGRFEIGGLNSKQKINYNHLASYLFYQKYEVNDFEYRYHTVLNKEKCAEYKKNFEDVNLRRYGIPIHMDADMIENWYPKTFSDRIDYILLYLNSHIPHTGQEIALKDEEIFSLLFVDRWDIESETTLSGSSSDKPREEARRKSEAIYMLDCLKASCYIDYCIGSITRLQLTPTGYSKVDELQKKLSSGRNVLVAMQFGDKTIPLREAIRAGIKEAAYNPIFIDEVQHNDLITTVLLKNIRDSKFVVVDLTHQNNGAYFEEGYAMGLGKPVIQLCKKDTQLHFDIAQKNTIMWEKEKDIPQKLCDRIKATID